MKNSSLAAHRISKSVVHLIFIIFCILNVFPLLWILMSSFKTNREFMANLFALPLALEFNNYVAAWDYSKIGQYFGNSLFVTFSSVALIIFFSLMIAYVLARYKFKLRNVIFTFFLFGMLVPLHSTLVPLFTLFKQFKMLNKFYTLLLPYVAFYMPFAIYILESFIRTIPKSLDEAAEIDGAGRFRFLFNIILPVAWPAIATVSVMTFLNIWNDFIFPLVLVSSDKYKTIQLGLQNFVGPMSADYPQLMAALAISTAPVFTLYMLFQKRLITGMTAGAVKG